MRNLDHDNGKNLELSEKIHPRDEAVGLEMTENGGQKASEDNRTIPLLLANGSGAAQMVDEHTDDVAESFGIPRMVTVNPGIGKCGRVCGDRVQRPNPPGNNVTNFAKSHDFNSTRLAK